jgi:DNA-binding IclR family transcriptional regulator
MRLANLTPPGKGDPGKPVEGSADRRPARPNSDATSSVGRAFQILNLFTMETPVIEIDDVVTSLGYTRSTAYRYVKELCEAGLLTPTVSGGQYSLGARIVELERLLELTDPLYRAGKAVLESLGQDDSSLLLQSLNHRNQVLCIYKKGPDVLEHDGLQVALTRSRGVPFPLFRGAASLVILACLTLHRIRQTYLSDSARIAEAGLGRTWEEFRSRMAAIRRRGYAVSRTERKTPLVLGIAVPIFLPPPNDKRVVGSLVQVFAHDLTPAEEASAFDRLQGAGQRIASQYVQFAGCPDRTQAQLEEDPADAAAAGTPFNGWQLIS